MPAASATVKTANSGEPKRWACTSNATFAPFLISTRHSSASPGFVMRPFSATGGFTGSACGAITSASPSAGALSGKTWSGTGSVVSVSR